MPKATKPLISICVPVLNERDNLTELYRRLTDIAKRMDDKIEVEFIFSDNHSDDGTWEKLSELATLDERVKAIRFSKNFGFQRSIIANYMHASGDAVMQIDADLQDPPELLEEFFSKWHQGYHVVFGVRRKRPEGLLIFYFRKLGYWIIDKLSEHDIPRNAGDFRLIDRKVVDAVCSIKSPNPYIRGMIAGLGFSQIGIPYDRSPRSSGESKFNLSKLVVLGMSGLLNHSTIPLRLAPLIGGLILAVSVIASIYYVTLKLFNPDLPRGLASIHILVLFGIGINALFLGIIGDYLRRMYLIVQSEPIAVIEESLNFDTAKLKL